MLVCLLLLVIVCNCLPASYRIELISRSSLFSKCHSHGGASGTSVQRVFFSKASQNARCSNANAITAEWTYSANDASSETECSSRFAPALVLLAKSVPFSYVLRAKCFGFSWKLLHHFKQKFVNFPRGRQNSVILCRMFGGTSPAVHQIPEFWQKWYWDSNILGRCDEFCWNVAEFLQNRRKTVPL